jgi:hypothetical protein
MRPLEDMKVFSLRFKLSAKNDALATPRLRWIGEKAMHIIDPRTATRKEK